MSVSHSLCLFIGTETPEAKHTLWLLLLLFLLLLLLLPPPTLIYFCLMYFPSYRRLALEWVVTLAEAKPTLARKVTVTGLGGNNTATRTTPLPRCAMEVCFQMMLDIPDEVGWATAEDEEVVQARGGRAARAGAARAGAAKAGEAR